MALSEGVMDEQDRAALVEEIIARLDARGIPQGTWLADIERVRESLRQADGLLLKMRAALVTSLMETEP